MSRGPNKKLYPCFGYEITIDQAAEFACVAVASVRAQLTKLGGSMEVVMQAYDKRYGGVIARMEEAMEYDKDKKAMGDIMAALGLVEELETGSEPAEDLQANELPLADGGGIRILPDKEEEAEPVPEKMRITLEEIQPDYAQDRRNLAAINEAIEAVERLTDVDAVMEHAEVMRDDFLDKLKYIRLNAFEHLIDWDAIAGKG